MASILPNLVSSPPLIDEASGWGAASQRPTACGSLVGKRWTSTDVNGGTEYECRKDLTGGFSWVQVAAGVNAEVPVDTVSAPPASSSDTGTAGDLIATTSYLYICVATNTWRRVAISSF